MRKTALLSWAAISIIWALGSLALFWSGWNDVVVAYEIERLNGLQSCKLRYGSDPAAQGRCDIIFNLEYTQSIAISLANRFLGIFTPPAIGLLAIWFFVLRERDPRKEIGKNKRKRARK